MIPYDKLTSLLKLEEKATPGPWEWVAEDKSMVTLQTADKIEGMVLAATRCSSCQERVVPNSDTGRCFVPKKVDADLIAESRNILRELIQENLRLRAENDFLLEKARYDIIKIN